ncbi:Uncharacterised protein [Capnocytophaga ochracea]|uniref:DUF6850 domain-containing protein n=1 Tax=Capnocytophaga ochracea TaxID=1018 RepID=A0A2X2SQK4_CAPOC|nr:DUF6850 family outer membrane beta-barrel protein [Capnocytophaga ochracea]SQA95376.1 Uncharacterised protein [Capnocytophaga ochracea]
MTDWGKYRFSSVQTTYEGSDKQAYAQQYPEGHTAFSVKASSYFPYDSTRTLWGDASYINRTLKHIRWNESLDGELLYPYFTADALGEICTANNTPLRVVLPNNGNACIGVSL